MAKRNLNKVKLVLVAKNKTSNWLAKQIKKSPTTVSRWCTNDIQPSLETLAAIAKILDVDILELINSTKEKNN
ncbi:MAG: helix-turn-helix transcriptional regulator [Bacteroidota bacterium]